MKRFLDKANILFERAFQNPYSCCLVLGIILNIAVETLSRKSVVSMGRYLFQSPLVFLYNSLIIALTLSVAILCRKRVFAFSLLSVIWLGMGVVNSILLVFRTTPFTAVDIRLIESALSVLDMYFSVSQVILLALLLLIVLAVIVLLFFKMPKQKEKSLTMKHVCYVLFLGILVKLLSWGGTETGLLAENFGNINQAFKTYGFPYGFSSSLVNTGIDRPRTYSEDSMEELLEEVEENPISHNTNWYEAEEEEADNPNVIYLQLESFFDPAHVKGITFSENPIPTYTKLKEEYTSGYLNVPSVGAGTANTEFEILTGMNLDFFGPGEYPYKTILKQTTCESLAYNMKELGYSAHAIHNNEGTFYERNTVFSQLGFDTFTPIEYMRVRETTPMGWAKDKILTGEIKKALYSTEEKDVIYTISVQGHGSYPAEKMENPIIHVSGFKEQSVNNSFEYYVNEIHEMDLFLDELLTMLQTYPEKVLLILYGDHLPGFSFTEDDLDNGNVYQTEYIIWSNYEMEKEDRDLESYQLSAYVMERMGLHNGILTRYHQMFQQEDTYLEGLEMLEYDMLYGNLDVYGGENPYKATRMQMGTEPVLLYTTKQGDKGKSTLLCGRNFTEYSVVTINGEEVEGELISSFQISIGVDILHPGDRVEVHQIGNDRQILSTVSITIGE